jgi:hypothetical protein
MAMKY